MSQRFKSVLLATAMLGIGVLSSGNANAAPLVYSFTSGTSAAQAIFDIVAGNLQVTLTNTSLADVRNPAEVLNAVYWSGTEDLAVGSAILNAGSTVFYDASGQPARGVAAGGFGLDSNGDPITSDQGVSSTGLDIFGPGDLFPGDDLQSPASPNGVQYGLLSAGDNTGTGNGGITGSGGLIKNSVVFTLLDSTLLTPLSLAWIINVWFQYGTSLDEPQFRGSCTSGCPGDNTPEVPLPAALPLLLGGLGGLVWISRRQKRRGSSAA
jgi:hypothetical protein